MKNRGSSLKKWIDRYVGIFLIFFFSLFRRKKKCPSAPERIALLISAALGDTTLLSAIANDIRKALPNTEVIILCGPSNNIIVPFIKGADRCVALSMKNPIKDIKNIRALNVDILLDCGAWPRINALYALFSSARFTVGFKTRGQHRHYGFDQAVIHSDSVHELENYRNLALKAGITSRSLPSLIIKNNLPEAFCERRYIIFHLAASGTRHELRQWPVSFWQSLSEKLSGHHLPLYLSGADTDKPLNQKLSDKCPSAINIAGKYSFGETLAILKNAALVVSVNTGVMHIAAALDVPVIGLSGPTSENRWGPLGDRSVSITPKVEGCGFLNLGFEYQGQRQDCMNFIDVESVHKHCENILNS